MERVPMEDRIRLFSDGGSGYLARALEDYLRMPEIRHIYCSPYHPQTNGKLERSHETPKARLNLLVFITPEALRAAMAEFTEFYDYRRHHEGIGNAARACPGLASLPPTGLNCPAWSTGKSFSCR